MMNEWEIRYLQQLATQLYFETLGFIDYCDALLEDNGRLGKLRSLKIAMIDRQKPLEIAQGWEDWEDSDQIILTELAVDMYRTIDTLWRNMSSTTLPKPEGGTHGEES